MRPHPSSWVRSRIVLCQAAAVLLVGFAQGVGRADEVPAVEVEGQPLAANVERLLDALDFLGAPLPADDAQGAEGGRRRRRTPRRSSSCSTRTCCSSSPSTPRRASRSPAARPRRRCSRRGYTPVLVKVVNESTVDQAAAHHQPAGRAGLRRQARRADAQDRQLPTRRSTRTASSTSRCSRSRR